MEAVERAVQVQDRKPGHMPAPGARSVDCEGLAASVGTGHTVDLLLAVGVQQDADEFTHHHLVVVIEQLQVRNQLQFSRLEYRTWRHGRRSTILVAAKAKPINGHVQPLGECPQLVLCGNSLTYQPLARCMHRDRTARIPDIEVPGQFGRAIR